MTAEALDKYIAEYKQNSARLSFLTHDIIRLQKEVYMLRKNIVEDSISITPVLSNMPRGTSISDPTGKLGTAIASGYETKAIKELNKEIEIKKKEREKKEYAVCVVDEALNCLTDKERFIIKNKLIECKSWDELHFAFYREYNTHYTTRTLKHIKKQAMERMRLVVQ